MKSTFGSFLKEKRQEKNLTQKEIAKLLFVSDSAVSKWEKDIAHPDITLLPKLAELLSVTEHELITASIDSTARQEKIEAKKWRAFSLSWSLFFYISYIIALVPCFICNLAINKGLTWFWIVLSSLILAFTFTNLPKLIKKHKLILLPLSMFLALCLLLTTCAIYSGGNWLLIAILAVLLGLSVIFTPIYISKLSVFSKIKKFNDYISVGVVFAILNILLIVCNIYSVKNGYTNNTYWYFNVALPIILYNFVVINILISVKFLKLNRLLKTSIILMLVNLFIYLPPTFVKVKKPMSAELIKDANILKANLTKWTIATIEYNVHCIIFISLIVFAVAFFAFGLIKHLKNKK